MGALLLCGGRQASAQPFAAIGSIPSGGSGGGGAATNVFVIPGSGQGVITNTAGSVYTVGTNYIADSSGKGTNTTITGTLTIKGGPSFGNNDDQFVLGTGANGQAGIFNQDGMLRLMTGTNGFEVMATNQYAIFYAGDAYNSDGFLKGAFGTTSGNRVPIGKRPGRGFAGTYRNSNAGIDSYFQSVGGSGAAMSDLPVDGRVIAANQRKPYVILDTRSGNGSDADNMVSCSLTSVTNGVLAFRTNGYLAYFTNLNVGIAFCMENGWATNHRDANTGLLRWNTNRFWWLTGNDTMATNLTKYLATNNIESWLMMYGDSWVPAYQNWPGSTTSELDVNPLSNNGRWDYPYGANGTGAADANVQPVMTSDSYHKDISAMYMWGISGIIFQDVNPGSTSGVFDQSMRTAMGAILNPYYRPGQLTEEVDVDQQFNAYYKGWPYHGMISGYLMGGPGASWSTKYAASANQLWTETADTTTEPAGSGPLGWLMGQIKYEAFFLTNMNTTLYPTFAGDGLNEATMTYQNWYDYFAGNAMFGGNLWLFKDYSYATSNSFGLLVTNGNFVSVWQDATRPITCERLDSTNAVFSRTLSTGEKLVWMANEGAAATNLTVNWGQLGIASNQIAWASDVFTNASLGKYTNFMTLTVPAVSSYLVKLSPGLNGDGSSLTNITYSQISGELWGTNTAFGYLTNVNGGGVAVLLRDSATRNGVIALWDTNSTTHRQISATNSGILIPDALYVGNAITTTGLTNSGLTASRMVLSDANKALLSAAASGAVPIDADGSATTSAQINTLFPSFVLTNNESQATTFSNNVTLDATHTLQVNGAEFRTGGYQARTSDATSTSTTLATTALSVTIPGTVNYTFDAILFFSESTSADGIKVDCGGGTATAGTFVAQAISIDTALQNSTQLTTLTTTAAAATFGTGSMTIHGFVSFSGTGTFIIRFAQNSHSTGTLTLKNGSLLRMQRTN